MALYALYVLRVSQLGRFEDGEESRLDSGRARALVLSASVMLVLVALLPRFADEGTALAGQLLAIGLAWPAAFTLSRIAFKSKTWSRADVERAMGLALRRLLMFTSALAALSWRPPVWDGLIVAAAILGGYVVSARLRRVFPPS